jgi:hypothetical protein
MTKEGRKDLRTTLVEAAWVALDRHPHWKAVFQRLAARIGKRKALVAGARNLLVVLWPVAPRTTLPITTPKTWPWLANGFGGAVPRAPRVGWVSRERPLSANTRDRLGLGKELTTFTYGTTKVTLPADPSLAKTG